MNYPSCPTSGPVTAVHKRSVKALQQALLKSPQWNLVLLSGEAESFEALIRRDKLNPRQTHLLRKLAFLAPEPVHHDIKGVTRGDGQIVNYRAILLQ